ncbi:hypothetical protein PMAYCL1PPCAC_25313, partial [Pristionchus mayeri]
LMQLSRSAMKCWHSRQEDGHTEIREGENLKEECYPNNLVASGCFLSQFDMYNMDGEELDTGDVIDREGDATE